MIEFDVEHLKDIQTVLKGLVGNWRHSMGWGEPPICIHCNAEQDTPGAENHNPDCIVPIADFLLFKYGEGFETLPEPKAEFLNLEQLDELLGATNDLLDVLKVDPKPLENFGLDLFPKEDADE